MRLLTYVAAALAIATFSSPLAAAEANKWFGKGVLVEVGGGKTATTEDQPNHKVMILDCDGAVVNADGGSFLDKARYQIVGIVDTAAGGYGYKTFTEADGAQVFAKYTVTELKLPDIKGTFEFTRGTGKYEGIKGGGQFHVTVLSDKTQYDELHGEYTLAAE
jgi:hypothetical protein